MRPMKNPGTLAGVTGASKHLTSNELFQHSMTFVFPQLPACHERLPAGLDPNGIIARHYWRADED